MGGGMGKTSSATSTQSSQFTPELMKLFNMAKPTLSTLSAQTQSGLQTGGVNTQIPSINASLAASRQAYSTSQQALKNQLGESGLANSSFGRQILGGSAEGAGQGINALPINMTNQFLGKAIPAVAGMGTNALSQAAGLNTSGKTTTTPSAWQSFVSAMHVGMDPAGVEGGANGGMGKGPGSAGGASPSMMGQTAGGAADANFAAGSTFGGGATSASMAGMAGSSSSALPLLFA